MGGPAFGQLSASGFISSGRAWERRRGRGGCLLSQSYESSTVLSLTCFHLVGFYLNGCCTFAYLHFAVDFTSGLLDPNFLSYFYPQSGDQSVFRKMLSSLSSIFQSN